MRCDVMKPLFVLIALCGCTNRANTMLGTAVPRATLRPPHEAIYVETPRGVARVYLDTGDLVLVDPDSTARAGGGQTTVIDEATSVSIRNGRYRVRRGDVSLEVPGLIAGEPPEVSPDGARFAVVQGPDGPFLEGRPEIAIVKIADLEVRRVPIPKPANLIRWSKDPDEVWFAMDRSSYRLVLATMEVLPLDPLALGAVREPPGAETCVSRGLRLEVQQESDRQHLVVVPIATVNAEELRGVEPRRLVSATNHSYSPHSSGWPGSLQDAFFTTACDHFVFVLRDRVYVGELATGRYSHLTAGDRASPTPRRR